jgi:DNA-binding NarL/FixJ family response regulator
MLTVQSDEEKLLRAIKYGAQGYLLKDLPSAKVLELIRGALRGEAALPPALAARVMEEFRRLSQQASALALEDHDLAPLTQREQEVLTLVARGASDKEIAQALHISLYTVKSHMRNILAKLQANSRQEAARFARQMGILD